MKTVYALQTTLIFSLFNFIEVCQKDRKKIVEKLCNIKQLKVFFALCCLKQAYQNKRNIFSFCQVHYPSKYEKVECKRIKRKKIILLREKLEYEKYFSYPLIINQNQTCEKIFSIKRFLSFKNNQTVRIHIQSIFSRTKNFFCLPELFRIKAI